MKYIYIVSRTVKDSNSNVSYLPILGVFASLKKAREHYDLVINWRVEAGFKLYWNMLEEEKIPKGIPIKNMSKAYLSLKRDYDEIIEELRIERWVLFTSKELRKKRN